jgi:hypothetical protein
VPNLVMIERYFVFSAATTADLCVKSVVFEMLVSCLSTSANYDACQNG